MPSVNSAATRVMPAPHAAAYPRSVLLAAAALLVVSAATILGALGFEHIGRYQPCALCLMQRIPYYMGVPLAALTLAATAFRMPRGLVILLFALFAVLMAVSAGLGVYHSGVEWAWWEGPAACSSAAPIGDAGDMLDQLGTVHPPSCTEATWRFLGLSFAGWNAVVSVFLATLSAVAVAMLLKRAW